MTIERTLTHAGILLDSPTCGEAVDRALDEAVALVSRLESMGAPASAIAEVRMAAWSLCAAWGRPPDPRLFCRPATVEEMRTAARLLERTPWHERFAAWLLRRRP